jgi:hypothetical protein
MSTPGTTFSFPGTFRLKPVVIERWAAESVIGADPWERGTPKPEPLSPF